MIPRKKNLLSAACPHDELPQCPKGLHHWSRACHLLIVKLSIGVQTFSNTCEGDYYYVGKTSLIERLIKQNKY